MAYVKKTAVAEDSNVEEKVEVAAQPTAVADDKDAKIAALEASLAQMQEFMKAMMANMNNKPAETNSAKDALFRYVTVIHLVDRAPGLSTHIELSNGVILDFRTFGEEHTFTVQQAEELASKYRSWFDLGIFAFGADADDLAKRLNLKTVTQYSFAGSDFLCRLPELDLYQLKALWDKMGQGHREFLIEYFKRKILAKDPSFDDIDKIELLNRLSNGGMEGVLLDRKNAAIKAEEASRKRVK